MTESEHGKPTPASTDKERVDYPRKADRQHLEEYAAEVTPAGTYSGNVIGEGRIERAEIDAHAADSHEPVQASQSGRTVGYVGVGLGIAALFMWSIILGPLAAVMGFYAYSQGHKTSGAWGIGLGIVSTLSYFVLMPFTR